MLFAVKIFHKLSGLLTKRLLHTFNNLLPSLSIKVPHFDNLRLLLLPWGLHLFESRTYIEKQKKLCILRKPNMALNGRNCSRISGQCVIFQIVGYSYTMSTV